MVIYVYYNRRSPRNRKVKAILLSSVEMKSPIAGPADRLDCGPAMKTGGFLRTLSNAEPQRGVR